MSFKFRVFSADRDDLEDYIASVPNWDVGDVLYRDGKPAYRITAVIPMHDLDNEVYHGIWEVEPIGAGARASPVAIATHPTKPTRAYRAQMVFRRLRFDVRGRRTRGHGEAWRVSRLAGESPSGGPRAGDSPHCFRQPTRRSLAAAAQGRSCVWSEP